MNQNVSVAQVEVRDTEGVNLFEVVHHVKLIVCIATVYIQVCDSCLLRVRDFLEDRLLHCTHNILDIVLFQQSSVFSCLIVSNIERTRGRWIFRVWARGSDHEVQVMLFIEVSCAVLSSEGFVEHE